MQVPRRTYIYGIALLALYFLGAYIYGHISRPDSVTVISTETIPRLAPHTHTESDKVSDHYHGIVVRSEPFTVPETMWVTEFRVDVENAPVGVVHHLDLVRLKEDGTRNRSYHSLLSFGQETPNVMRFPAPSGMRLTKGEKIGIEAVIHNATPPAGEGGTYENVSASVTLRHVPEGEGRSVPLYFSLPRVTDSVDEDDDDSTFTVPPKSEHVTVHSEDNPESASGAIHLFERDGWILVMGGHLHSWQGGERVDAFINGKQVRSFTSHLQDPAVSWSWYTPGGFTFIPVEAGDVFSVSATYSNQSEKPIVGAMGMVGIFYTKEPFSLTPPFHELWWHVCSAFFSLLSRFGIYTN